ncbi:hypothetical protein LTR37_011025 [Vermiconidia calcicola]|uniref:Uncharacterized protein n=1 Tax=Vermiconidia calcicola TaxID=1690605 RepID=A0ACC3N3C6_9PEZI|nr:hypothetical protein LTR37_011025 [Vermiconidia calcicola]
MLTLDLAQRVDANWNFTPGRDFIESFVQFQVPEELSLESLLLLKERAKRVKGTGQNDEPYLETIPEVDDLFKNYFPASLQSLRITHVYRNIEKPLIGEPRPPGKLYEDVLNDEKLKAQLDKEYSQAGMVDLRTADSDKCLSIPRGFVIGDYKASNSNYLAKGAGIRHLPPLWQAIVAEFNAAGVRVKVGVETQGPLRHKIANSRPFAGWMGPPVPVIDFDDNEQMAKSSWRSQDECYWSHPAGDRWRVHTFGGSFPYVRYMYEGQSLSSFSFPD